MDLKELMKDAGIVGAGGAGFPSYAKLADGVEAMTDEVYAFSLRRRWHAKRVGCGVCLPLEGKVTRVA